MIDLSKAMSFEAYLQKSFVEHGDIQQKKYENTQLSNATKVSLKEISDPVHVAVFSEGFCPDCVVTLPFIKRMQEENPKINLYFFPRSGYEILLEEFTSSVRIPTIISFDKNMSPKGAYVELPKKLTELMIGLSSEEKKNLIQEYRDGKYNHLIEEELIQILL